MCGKPTNIDRAHKVWNKGVGKIGGNVLGGTVEANDFRCSDPGLSALSAALAFFKRALVLFKVKLTLALTSGPVSGIVWANSAY